MSLSVSSHYGPLAVRNQQKFGQAFAGAASDLTRTGKKFHDQHSRGAKPVDQPSKQAANNDPQVRY